MGIEDKNDTLESLKKIIEERKGMKDKVTTCEWCGMTYPKGGWTYYQILVRNMSIEKVVYDIEKGIKDDIEKGIKDDIEKGIKDDIEKGIKDDDFERHIICSDCYDRLKICKEC